MICLFTGRTRGLLFAAAARDVSLAADDGLNPTTLHRVVERDRAEHVAVIGHRTRGHLQFFNPFGEWFDLDGAVEKAVVSMKMEVYELTVLHCYLFRRGFSRKDAKKAAKKHYSHSIVDGGLELMS